MSPLLGASKPRITRRGASREDIPFLARIDEIASTPPFERPMWDSLVAPFGVTTRAFLEAMFTADASNWGGVADFLVLEVDGQPAAACAVFGARFEPCDRRVLRLERLPDIARLLGWDRDTTQRFQSQYEALWGPPDPLFLQPQAPAIIETVGALPEFRGLGLGDRLMEEAKAEARRRGHDAIGVMAIHGNDRAQALYARHFEPWATFHPALFEHKFPGVTKYLANLHD